MLTVQGYTEKFGSAALNSERESRVRRFLNDDSSEIVSAFLSNVCDVDVRDSSLDPLETQVKIALALRELLAQMIEDAATAEAFARAAALREVKVVDGIVDFAPLTEDEVKMLGRYFMGGQFKVAATLNETANAQLGAVTVVSRFNDSIADLIPAGGGDIPEHVLAVAVEDGKEAASSVVEGYFASYLAEVTAPHNSVKRFSQHYSTDGYVVGHGLCGTAALADLFIKQKMQLAPITHAQRVQAHGGTSDDQSLANDKPAENPSVQLFTAVSEFKAQINGSMDSNLTDAVKKELTGAIDRQCQQGIADMFTSHPVQSVKLLLAQCKYAEQQQQLQSPVAVAGKSFADELASEIADSGGEEAYIAKQAALFAPRASTPLAKQERRVHFAADAPAVVGGAG